MDMAQFCIRYKASKRDLNVGTWFSMRCFQEVIGTRGSGFINGLTPELIQNDIIGKLLELGPSLWE